MLSRQHEAETYPPKGGRPTVHLIILQQLELEHMTRSHGPGMAGVEPRALCEAVLDAATKVIADEKLHGGKCRAPTREELVW